MTSLNIKYSILPDNIDFASYKIKELTDYIKKTNKPAAFLIKRQTFTSEKDNSMYNNNGLNRYEIIKQLVNNLKDFKFISTTGFTSRELYSIRKERNEALHNDFYTVGSMGHTSSIACAYSLFSNNKTVCIDGDGSLLMHMGVLSSIGNIKPKNFIHILLNNKSHESVGGQTTNSNCTKFYKIAKACGYTNIYNIETMIELKNLLKDNILLKEGPIFIEIKTNIGTLNDLKRPKKELVKIKKDFINN